jgi:1-acyl-sn-glycerol-3-phosphate acyltransferase
MSGLHKPLQLLYTFWAGFTYVLFMLIAFPFFYFVYFTFEELRAHGYVMRFIRWWAATWGWMCGIRYRVYGLEKVPQENCYVFISNHSSNLDAMVWAYANNRLMKGLAKKEITKMPVLGYLFKKTSVIVERGSKESRQQSMFAMRAAISRNVSIFMFPEGTRNKLGVPLMPFYDGAFRVAIDLQIPIAPLVMCTPSDLMPPTNFFYKPGTVKCIFLDPIPTVGMTEDDLEKLKKTAFDAMHHAILQHDERCNKVLVAT